MAIYEVITHVRIRMFVEAPSKTAAKIFQEYSNDLDLVAMGGFDITGVDVKQYDQNDVEPDATVDEHGDRID